jgi:hypothetical protein
VNGATGDDAWDGRCETWDGGTCGPKATIQAGIAAAVADDEVVIADGTYTGPGNENLDFNGKAITVRSASGDRALCVIDCENNGRGFAFHSGEGAISIVDSVTITRGRVASGSNYGGGGAVHCTGGVARLTNCTLTGNSTGGSGGGLFCAGNGPSVVTNCILWSDAPQEIRVNDPYASLLATYCNVQDGWPGAGNIAADPLFVDPDDLDNDPNTLEDNDHHRSAGSPCTDAGNNAAVPAEVPFDLDGLPRNTDGADDSLATVDMGAYERPAVVVGDSNCDGVIDYCDINVFVCALVEPAAYPGRYPGCNLSFAGCNGDGLVNFYDISPFIDSLLRR